MTARLRSRTGKRFEKRGIQWDIVLRILKIAVPLTLIIYLGFWYVLQPYTQYHLRRWFLSLRYDNIDAYYPQSPPVKYSYEDPISSTYQVQYLYRLNLENKSFREIYSRSRVSWPSNAVWVNGHLIISDGKSVFRFDEATQQTTTYMSDLSQPAHLHLLTSTDDGVYIAKSFESTQRVMQYTISAVDMARGTTRTLFDYEPDIFEVPHTVIASDPYYLVVGSGDGCGGYQRIFVIENGKQRHIAEFGDGCVAGPRYLGVMNDKTKVLAAATLAPEESEFGARYCRYDVLYSYELATGNIQPIMDLKPINGCIKNISYDRITNLALIVTEDAVYITDISKAIITRIMQKSFGAFYFSQYGDKLASYVDNQKDKYIGILDIQTGATMNIPWDYQKGRAPSFVGRDGNELLISTIESHTE